MGYTLGGVEYQYRRSLTASASLVGTVAADFPSPVFPPTLASKVLANFNDAVFTAADGETLTDWYWESKVAAAAVGSVKIPAAFVANDLAGYLYYNVIGADPGDQSDEAGTFSSLIARYALSELDTVLPLDSTANSYDATANTADEEATGKIGKAFDYELDNADSTTLPNSNLLIPTETSFYLSGWINVESVAAGVTRTIAVHRRAAASGFCGLQVYGSILRLVYPDATAVDGTTALSTGTWYHVAYNKSGDNNVMYLNGVLEASAIAAFTAVPSADPSLLGVSSAGNTNYFDGLIDEVRIGAEKSVSWALAEYMAGADTLWTWGAEEEAGRILLHPGMAGGLNG